MYGKLCKYEFKSIARTLFPIYLAVIAVSLINAVSFGVNDLFDGGMSGYFNAAAGSAAVDTVLNILQFISVFTYFGVMVALFVLTVIVIIQRFYKGLLCDEGYLMFTLPVKTWQLVASKGTAAFVMALVSGVTAMVSIFILMCGAVGPVELCSEIFNSEFWNVVLKELNETFPRWSMYLALYLVEGLIFLMVSGMKGLYQMYASMALGHLANKHRILMSVAAYLGISVGLSFFGGTGLVVLDNAGITNAFSSLFGTSAHAAMQAMYGGSMLWSLLQLAGFFFATDWILERRLNLE
ncbi:MAG: hypothetical protein J6D13_05185 [Clostridium sp.]|nr:hypothetical protein [Clostridium sp.]